MVKNKRFIDECFPIKEVSRESVREKNIRHGHISTLHIWWARRPLASSRATSYAALIPAPKNEKEKEEKKRFIVELSKWENSLNLQLMRKVREEILNANNGVPPKVLDPFAGGGSIPLECLRLGCEVHAGEYNPVAVLILKCTLEYPQKYGEPKKVKGNFGLLKESRVIKNPLLEDVKKWGNLVLEEAKKEIGRFYPSDNDGSIPVGYIWARTIPCQNPSCETEIPLMRQFWLAKKENRKITLRPTVRGKKVEFEIVENPDFDPSKGTVSRAIAYCLVCGSTIDYKTVRKLFQQGDSGQRMVAVVLHNPKTKGKTYRIATNNDLKVYREAEKYLEKKRIKLMEKWGIDPVPDEPTPEGKGKGAERAFSVRNFGLNTYGDLFNSRQKLALITYTEKVREAYRKMIEEGYDKEYAKAILSYLGIAIDRLASFSSNLTLWVSEGGFLANTFTRQTLPMIWDYCELNPFSEASGDWNSAMNWILRVIRHCSQSISSNPTAIFQSSSTSLPYQDNYFDAVFTDPPYYDNVPYSYLSDFFYVWLKRIIENLYPDLFATPLTPKSKEIVAYTINRTWEEAKEFFEENLKKSFIEIYRVLKPNGIATIVYTHKSTSGWEALINSILDSGLVITASWPIHTERTTRLRARESAALASSIYFVAHKTERKEIGWYNDVKDEVKKRIYEKLESLWEEGISGADYFIAAIGSAVEIFGKYKEIRDFEGNIIRADKLLDFVRSVVTDYVVRQILQNGIAGELSPLTKFYLLWRWTYKEAKVHFDDARKLAQSVGLDLPSEWNRGFIKKEKEYIRVIGPQDRVMKKIERPDELVEVLHSALILWKEGKKEEMKKVLAETGWGTRDVFYRVAQATSETLPSESKEKKLLDGFLSGKEKILMEVERTSKQKKLMEFI
jgi:adenine-specific DNA methylase